jgi:glycogenin glucosyltransferase
MPEAPEVADQVWVTLATNDSYALGTLVLGHSLRRVGTKRAMLVMVTPQVSSSMREILASVYNEVKEVNVLDSNDESNLALIERPDLGVTFTKLHCWRLTQFSKGVFLDADTMLAQNCDELFEREELSAAPDVGWPDCFNSGVFVFKPNEDTYQSLLHFAVSYGSFDGGDQGLLNLYFNDWATKDIAKHLPFVYNMVATTAYSYLPAVKQYGKDVKIVHFLGATKPWMHQYDPVSGNVTVVGGPAQQHVQGYLKMWWDLFAETVLPKMTGDYSGLAASLAELRLVEHKPKTEQERYAAWENGKMDYLGDDSFAKIQAKLDAAVSTPKPAVVSKKTPSKTSAVAVAQKK